MKICQDTLLGTRNPDLIAFVPVREWPNYSYSVHMFCIGNDQSHSHQNTTWSLPQNELRQATNSHTIWIAIQQPPHVLYYFARQHKQDTSTRLWQRSCLSGLGPTFVVVCSASCCAACLLAAQGVCPLCQIWKDLC